MCRDPLSFLFIIIDISQELDLKNKKKLCLIAFLEEIEQNKETKSFLL